MCTVRDATLSKIMKFIKRCIKRNLTNSSAKQSLRLRTIETSDDLTSPTKYTSYLSFLLHRQECSVHLCSTQKCANCDKRDIASKQRKSRKDSIHCKFVMWRDFEPELLNCKCGAIFHDQHTHNLGSTPHI